MNRALSCFLRRIGGGRPIEHVLTIGRGGPTFDGLVNLLWKAGVRSIFRADDLDEARSLLEAFRPRVILALPDAAAAHSDRELYDISNHGDIPVIAMDRTRVATIEGLMSSPVTGQKPGADLAFAA